MKKATTILELSIVEIAEGENKGRAQDIVLNPKTNEVYLLLKGGKPGEVFLLKAKDIIGMGEDFILIKDSGSIKHQEEEEVKRALKESFYLLGVRTVNFQGTQMGSIADFILDDTTKQIKTITLEDGTELDAAKLLSVCEDYVFIQTSETEAKEHREQAIKIEIEEVKEKAVAKDPTIGLRLTRDVTSEDGAFFAPEGSYITEEMLETAEKHNALITLAMYSN